MLTKEAAAIQMIKAVADAIKELGKIPSGHLYARLMPYLDLPSYEKIIGILERSGVIRKTSDVLYWNV